jgi:hypothetical protein
MSSFQTQLRKPKFDNSNIMIVDTSYNDVKLYGWGGDNLETELYFISYIL